MSIRMKKFIKNFRGTPRNHKARACSRCAEILFSRKAARIHFRLAHGFSCMEVT
jgi:RNase P subunit RPR2